MRSRGPQCQGAGGQQHQTEQDRQDTKDRDGGWNVVDGRQVGAAAEDADSPHEQQPCLPPCPGVTAHKTDRCQPGRRPRPPPRGAARRGRGPVPRIRWRPGRSGRVRPREQHSFARHVSSGCFPALRAPNQSAEKLSSRFPQPPRCRAPVHRLSYSVSTAPVPVASPALMDVPHRAQNRSLTAHSAHTAAQPGRAKDERPVVSLLRPGAACLGCRPVSRQCLHERASHGADRRHWSAVLSRSTSRHCVRRVSTCPSCVAHRRRG